MKLQCSPEFHKRAYLRTYINFASHVLATIQSLDFRITILRLILRFNTYIESQD